MRMLKRIVMFLGLLVFCGCCAIADASKVFLESVGREYVKYVDEDGNLTIEEKIIRKLHVKAFTAAVEEANELEGGMQLIPVDPEQPDPF